MPINLAWFAAESSAADTWFAKNYPTLRASTVAYFCAEYGFHESFPIYSGGLGVLAGDHCKTASDMALEFVAVGLLYREGYFTQTLDGDGNQAADRIERLA